MANRPIHYLPCSIVCHGESELIFVKQLQVNNRRSLNPLADKNGKQTIMIDTINKFLNSLFPSKQEYLKKTKDLICVQKGKIINHKIFCIMDKDDKSDALFNAYKNKELFKEEWWGKEDLIVPIYFDPSLDEIFTKNGFPINKKRSKPAQYFKYLSMNFDQVIEMLKNVPISQSNISVLLDYLVSLK